MTYSIGRPNILGICAADALRVSYYTINNRREKSYATLFQKIIHGGILTIVKMDVGHWQIGQCQYERLYQVGLLLKNACPAASFIMAIIM